MSIQVKSKMRRTAERQIMRKFLSLFALIVCAFSAGVRADTLTPSVVSGRTDTGSFEGQPVALTPTLLNIFYAAARPDW